MAYIASTSTNVKETSKRELVDQETIQYIRPITIQLTMTDGRPNTRVYVFFGDTPVSHLCGMVGNGINTPLVTDNEGKTVIDLEIPGGTFNTGEYTITVADVDTLEELNFTGSVYGSATGTFKSNGKIEYYQTTKTKVTTVQKIVQSWDPLAQSFFTYGVPNGVFLSSIDLYFQTKDDQENDGANGLPVRVDVRPLVNGYPASEALDDVNFSCTVSAKDVKVPTDINDASQATRFTFNPPIYLEGESDFCFVVFSNSRNYNLFTSKMGERSLETGNIIFEQPYMGSLFRSENNVTWTAEQSEDIKFVINRAEFDINATSNVEFRVEVPAVSAYGEQFETFQGSNIIRYTHTKKHGLEVGSSIGLFCQNDLLFNGIPSSNFTGKTFQVTSVVDGNTVEFELDGAVAATSTGKITTGNGVTHLHVDKGGLNYESTSTISIGEPFTASNWVSGATVSVGSKIKYTNGNVTNYYTVDSGTTLGTTGPTHSTGSATNGGTVLSYIGTRATANPVIVNGAIVQAQMTNAGFGYETAPTVQVESSFGSGAKVLAFVTVTIGVKVNKPLHGFTPNMKIYNFGTTKTNNQITTTIGNYENGPLNSYTQGKTIPFIENDFYVDLNQNSLIASLENETDVMGDDPENPSAKVSIELVSTDSKLSPYIDTKHTLELLAYNKKVSNQIGENLNSSSPTGSVDTIGVTTAGSNYTEDPIVTISAPDIEGGIQATAHAVRTGSIVTSIVVDEAGSGYIKTPLVTIVRDEGAGDTTGAGASAAVTLTSFNSELLPNGGNASAKYLTRKTGLETISTGIRLFSVISSFEGSSVDWYIKTSLSSNNVDHDSQPWVRLNCDVERNRPDQDGKQFEYTFYKDNLPAFNTYNLKCVMTAEDPTKSPSVHSYRVIVVL